MKCPELGSLWHKAGRERVVIGTEHSSTGWAVQWISRTAGQVKPDWANRWYEANEGVWTRWARGARLVEPGRCPCCGTTRPPQGFPCPAGRA